MTNKSALSRTPSLQSVDSIDEISRLVRAQDDFRTGLELLSTTVSHYRIGRSRKSYTPAACCQMAVVLREISSRLMRTAVQMAQIEKDEEGKNETQDQIAQSFCKDADAR